MARYFRAFRPITTGLIAFAVAGSLLLTACGSNNQTTRTGPPQPARDHQVQDGEQIAVELPHEPLAHAPHRDQAMSFERGDGRIERAHEKRARDAHFLERAVENPRPKRAQVQLDVRQFRHASESSGSEDAARSTTARAPRHRPWRRVQGA